MTKQAIENFPSVVHIRVEAVKESQDYITIFMVYLDGPLRGQRFTSVMDLPGRTPICRCDSCLAKVGDAKTRRTNG